MFVHAQKCTPWRPVGGCACMAHVEGTDLPGKLGAQKRQDMANLSSDYIIIGAPFQINVTVSPAVRQPPQVQQVLVTPLSSIRSNQAHWLMSNQAIINPPIKKVMLKAVNRGSKGKEPKTFTLRDVRPEAMTSYAAVKCLIKVQLSQDITMKNNAYPYLDTSKYSKVTQSLL